MSLLPKINMAEVTRLTKLGRVLEATALLRGRRPREGGEANQHPPASQRPQANQRLEASQRLDAPVEPQTSQFLSRSFSNGAGSRAYRLFVPSGARGKQLPLVVMLHGCTQSPEDFAAGTRMNLLGEEQQVFVAYPAQSSSANSSRCWNWFNAADQVRDRGEPSIVAGITREILREFPVDPSRVYIAGLSAGGAAAATMAALYPDVYAGVCVHSGLACGAARDMMSAFGAMKSGGTPAATRALSTDRVPTIVFHGDRDATVSAINGDQVAAQARGEAKYQTSVSEGRGPHGTPYSKTVESDRRGRVMLEHWVLHGGGHAWSGGSADGSYTDPNGVDASREMLRFFAGHSLA